MSLMLAPHSDLIRMGLIPQVRSKTLGPLLMISDGVNSYIQSVCCDKDVTSSHREVKHEQEKSQVVCCSYKYVGRLPDMPG